MKPIVFTIFISLLTLTSGCYDGFQEVGKVRFDSLNQKWEFPLVNQISTVSDIFTEFFDSVLVEEGGDFEGIKFRSDMDPIQANELFKIDIQPISIFIPSAIGIAGVEFQQEITESRAFNFVSNGDQLESITFFGGDGKMTLSSRMPAVGTIRVEILNLKDKNGLPFDLTFNLNNSQSRTFFLQEQRSLKGFTFDFLNGNIPSIDARISFDLTFTRTAQYTIDFNFSMDETEFESITGQFVGRREIASGQQEVDIFSNDQIKDSTFRFLDKQFNVIFNNTFDVEIDLTLDRLEGNGFLPNGALRSPALLGRPFVIEPKKQSILSFDNSNSNIDLFLDTNPEQINYQVSGIYKGELVSRTIHRDNALESAVEITVPFNVRVSEYTDEEDVGIDVSTVDFDNLEQLKIIVNNNLPLEGRITFQMLEELPGNNLRSLGYVTEDSITGIPSGLFTSPSEPNPVLSVFMTEDLEQKLKATDKIRIHYTISTPGEEYQVFRQSSSIQFKIVPIFTNLF